MSEFILHVTSQTTWSAAQKGGQYVTDSLAGEGFIHCSKADQIMRVANLSFTRQRGLVLLVIDPALLIPELRWEPGVDLATELFPHIYGPINLDAVVEVLDFENDTDGKFHLPKLLEFAAS
ncbi:MAG: DUF952 domain-containing protein [Anaerolineales bacterium]